MKEQFQHKLTTSFFLWFDNFLLKHGEAYSNKTGQFYYYEDSRLDSDYRAYGSPYKQWVTDSSITGANIPTGVHFGNEASGRSDGIVFDFDNGRVLVEGSVTGSTITGEFAVKDFSVYITNDTKWYIRAQGTMSGGLQSPSDFSGQIMSFNHTYVST